MKFSSERVDFASFYVKICRARIFVYFKNHFIFLKPGFFNFREAVSSFGCVVWISKVTPLSWLLKIHNKTIRGEIIRNAVADKREKLYEEMQIGSDYMFRVDEVCNS